MTLTSTTNRSTHTGNNSTTAFSYSFKIFDQAEIDVYLDGVKKTITTHYTISGVGADAGGSVTFTSGNTPGTGVAIVFVRNIAQTQTTDYTVTGQINPQTIEDALDKLTMRNQKSQMNADESFGFADSVTDAGTVRISETSANRANMLLAFDASGNLASTQEIGTHTGNWAASTAYVLRDIIKDTDNNNIYICIVAHTSSGAVPISTNADSAKWRLIIDAAAATTSATAAAASATAAATSATASATSATTSSTQATNSATSATASATSATSSASSATTSASSATSSTNYATKVDGAVTGSDYSSKAWAVGGTGVTDTSSRGAAKEWATAAEDDQVDGSEYSAKHYSAKASASATSAAASAATVPTPATIKDGTYWGYTTGGSANAYTLTTSPVITAYAADMFFNVKISATNTTLSTINVDSVGVKNIKKYCGQGIVPLAAGDLESGGIYTIVYDGTQFIVVGANVNSSGWESVVGFTRASDTTFSVTDNAANQAIFKVGVPVRTSEDNSTWRYSIIATYSSGTVTIRGYGIPTSDDAYMQVGSTTRVDVWDIYIPSTFADAAAATLVATDAKMKLIWTKGLAYIVGFDTICITADSGANDPRINVDVNGANALSSSNSNEGLNTSDSRAATTNDLTVANMDITYGNTLEISTDANGSNNDAADLTVQIIFVLV